MKPIACIFALLIALMLNAQGPSPELPVKWAELTAPDFVEAVEKSAGVCILPLGVLERHGPHMPLGTDIFIADANAVAAAKEEYAVVFPAFFVGQINEARHQPGTVSYSHDLIWKMLLETCNEIARNGFEKIIIVNGHGGNNDLLRYFSMSLLSEPRDFLLYIYAPSHDTASSEKVTELLNKLPAGAAGDHAGATETSYLMTIRPDLLKMDQVATNSGSNLNRLSHLPNVYTGIWWYARYPNHYAGDAAYASLELGNALSERNIKALAKMIRDVKADTSVKELQDRFYRDATNPLNTAQ